MISKTALKGRIQGKTNSGTVELLQLARKLKSWYLVAQLISRGTRTYPSFNLSEIDQKSKAGDTIVIPGKVLSQGDLTKKLRICALGISEKARNKLKATKSEFIPLIEEVRKNPKAEGIKLLAQ